MTGVMRFLQLEWHNHERARNAWDIERAEMKAKIAKQEGEVRSAKKLNDQLNKHIRMLEQALTNERKKKAEAEASGDAAAGDKKDSKGKKSGLNPTKRGYIVGRLLRDYTNLLVQPRTRSTTPSWTLIPSSSTAQKPIGILNERRRKSTSRNASKKSHTSSHPRPSPRRNSRTCMRSQTGPDS
jgi:hypothetical protein